MSVSFAKRGHPTQRGQKSENVHHMAYEEDAYCNPRAGGWWLREVFRDLPCLQVYLDVVVHDILHHRFGEPTVPPDEVMDFFIARHRAGECGCYTSAARLTVDILLLPHKKNGVDKLPCLSVVIDWEAYTKFIIPYATEEPEPLLGCQVERLRSNHDLGLCACYNPAEHGKPSIWAGIRPATSPIYQRVEAA